MSHRLAHSCLDYSRHIIKTIQSISLVHAICLYLGLFYFILLRSFQIKMVQSALSDLRTILSWNELKRITEDKIYQGTLHVWKLTSKHCFQGRDVNLCIQDVYISAKLSVVLKLFPIFVGNTEFSGKEPEPSNKGLSE